VLGRVRANRRAAVVVSLVSTSRRIGRKATQGKMMDGAGKKIRLGEGFISVIALVSDPKVQKF
jgi:hypothetical protein